MPAQKFASQKRYSFCSSANIPVSIDTGARVNAATRRSLLVRLTGNALLSTNDALRLVVPEARSSAQFTETLDFTFFGLEDPSPSPSRSELLTLADKAIEAMERRRNEDRTTWATRLGESANRFND
jgi:hypothetical protein